APFLITPPVPHAHRSYMVTQVSALSFSEFVPAWAFSRARREHGIQRISRTCRRRLAAGVSGITLRGLPACLPHVTRKNRRTLLSGAPFPAIEGLHSLA